MFEILQKHPKHHRRHLQIGHFLTTTTLPHHDENTALSILTKTDLIPPPFTSPIANDIVSRSSVYSLTENWSRCHHSAHRPFLFKSPNIPAFNFSQIDVQISKVLNE